MNKFIIGNLKLLGALNDKPKQECSAVPPIWNAESQIKNNAEWEFNIKINKTPKKIRARTTSILHIFKKEKCMLGNKPITITVFRYS